MVAPKKIKHKAVLNFIDGSSETTLVRDSNWNIHPNMAKIDTILMIAEMISMYLLSIFLGKQYNYVAFYLQKIILNSKKELCCKKKSIFKVRILLHKHLLIIEKISPYRKTETIFTIVLIHMNFNMLNFQHSSYNL